MKAITFEDVIHWFNTPIIHIGETPLTLSGMGTSFVVIIVAFIISKLVRKAIDVSLKEKFKLDSGVSYAIQRFVHYGIIVIGVIIASQSIGLNLGSLAVIFGFLSVGIGFGLQNITSNFISGLILLLERPISVGDLIEVDGKISTVLHINMRSTIVMTLDNVTLIVPNSHLIENQVTNWSIEDPRVRIHCPVGVAYGSNIPLVKETLEKVAASHKEVLSNPAPDVRFLEFGDSSLNFDLLVWIQHPKRQHNIQSEINYLIDDAFRENNIQIPFPQRDVHLQVTPAVDQLAGAKPEK